MLALPYTASDPVTLAVCLHKSFTCNMLKAHGVPTPAGVTVSGTRVPPFALPAMVKPLHEGSSKGIRDSSLCRTQAELRREVARVRRLYRQPARVERYLRGREFTVGLLGNLPQVQVLPIVEIRFDQLPARANPIYSYEAKWLWDTAEHPLAIFDCPARVSAGLRRAIEGVCLRAYEALGIRDWCRMDVRLDDRGVPNILEVNPLPGILPDPRDNSCLPKAARAAGLTYSQLIHRVLEAAIRRCGLRSFTTKAR
jgi:D-alanine-D-alanine ligase